MDAVASPNAEHIAVWNEILVPKFKRFRRVLVEGLGAHSRLALKRAHPKTGARVLDVGCGFGETSTELARAVGPTGSVLGIDVCGGFLDIARAEAAEAGLSSVTFQVADAQTARFPKPFDLCFSRFGTMFFQNPAAALGNLRRAVIPGGRLMMLVWRRLDDNEWAALPKQIVRAHLPPPPEDAASCGPGPFSMGAPDTVRAILNAGGWQDIQLEPIDATMTLGDTVDDAIAFALSLGPAGEVVREAGELGQAKQQGIEAALRTQFERRLTDRGVLMGSGSWCVTARSPGGSRGTSHGVSGN
jgi:ubiquinone/menaquinone biosynthesis C-methylase UbiE